MFLKNKNIIFKIKRSKVTDYAALTYMRKVIHSRTADGTQVKARFFLLVDLREVFF